MPTTRAGFAPTAEDVGDYSRLRAAFRDLSDRMVSNIPHRALRQVGRELGMLHQGDRLVFESLDASAVLMDCCLHDWGRDGTNLATTHTRFHPAPTGSDEARIQEALHRAQFALLIPERPVGDAGLVCRDLLADRELFLMDRGLSRNPAILVLGLATRILPIHERYWMTTGAALPVDGEILRSLSARLLDEKEESLPAYPSPAFNLMVIRTCLETGAAAHIEYVTSG